MNQTLDLTYDQRPKNYPKTADTVVSRVQKRNQELGVGISLLRQRWYFACRLPEKGCNYYSKVLHCSSRQSEPANGLQISRQPFYRNFVSSRQCTWWSLRALEIDSSSLRNSETSELPELTP